MFSAVIVVSDEDSLITQINAKYGNNNREFISSAEINEKRCLSWRDTTADITLVKASLVGEEDYLPEESLNIVALSEYFMRVPLAKIHLKWKEFDVMVVDIRNLISPDIFIRNYIKAMFSRVNIIT